MSWKNVVGMYAGMCAGYKPADEKKKKTTKSKTSNLNCSRESKEWGRSDTILLEYERSKS
jgi:hypothetical protein